MASAETPIVDTVDCLIQGRSLLKHPCYQTWQRDGPTLDVLPDLVGGGCRASLTVGTTG